MQFNYNQLRIARLYQVDFLLIICRWVALDVFYFKSFDLNSIRWIVWPRLSTKTAKAATRRLDFTANLRPSGSSDRDETKS